MQDKSMTKPAPRGRKRGKPVAVVKQGSTAVPIYRGTSRGATRFTVAFYLNGRRQRRTFGCLNTAKEEARRVALNIQRGRSGDNDLRPQERENFLTAMGLLSPLGLPLVGAIEEYVECRRMLGAIPLTVAVEDFTRRRNSFEAGVSVARVVEEILLIKEQDRVSSHHLKNLKSIYDQFVQGMPDSISEVTSQQIEAWIRRGDHSGTTRNNWLKRIKYLFDFAKRRGYLPRTEPTATESLKPVKVQDTEVGIFTPAEMQQILHAAPEEIIPFLAIGGFAGLRVAEIERLAWGAIDLDRRIIELRAGQAKTASRRIIPISDNLAAWLEPLDRRGAVISDIGIPGKARRQARKLGLDWPNNALRHSYISYRIAEVKNAAQVALEAGNSPAIIFKHYRELVTEAEAREWFGIFPGRSVDRGNGAS